MLCNVIIYITFATKKAIQNATIRPHGSGYREAAHRNVTIIY